VDELFFALDQDNDGVVSEAEFLAASALLPPVSARQTPSFDSDSDFGHHVDFAGPASGDQSGTGNGNNTGSSSSTAGISTASASSDEEVFLANGSKRISSIRSLQELFSDNTNGEASSPSTAP